MKIYKEFLLKETYLRGRYLSGRNKEIILGIIKNDFKLLYKEIEIAELTDEDIKDLITLSIRVYGKTSLSRLTILYWNKNDYLTKEDILKYGKKILKFSLILKKFNYIGSERRFYSSNKYVTLIFWKIERDLFKTLRKFINIKSIRLISNNSIKYKRVENNPRLNSIIKLGRVEIFINWNYLKAVIIICKDDEIWGLLIKESSRIENLLLIRKIVLRGLKELETLTCNGDKGIYYRITYDFRGRIYYGVSWLRPIGPKFIRPIFILEKIESPNINEKDIKKILKGLKWNVLNSERKYRNLYKKLNNIERNIVSLDARARGYQHLCSIFNIETIGECVGLRKNNKTIDFYSFVSEEVIKALPEELRMKFRGVRNKLCRQLFKKPLIVYIYGARINTINIYIYKEVLKHNESIILEREDIKIIISTLKVKLNEIIGYSIREIIGKCIDKDRGLVIYPDGFRINLIYKKINTIKIKTQYDGKRYVYEIRYKSCIWDSVKSKRRGLVNIIHSLDAIALSKIVDICINKNIKLIIIHDCVLVSKSDLAIVKYIFKNAYNDIYKEGEVFKFIIEKSILSNKKSFIIDKVNKDISWYFPSDRIFS